MTTMPEIIDLCIGEARAIRDITCKIFDLNQISLTMEPQSWEYCSSGYQPLVKFLENTYSANIVITNGANQALHAAMYALRVQGYKNLGFRSPYWNRIPEIAKHTNLKYTTFEGDIVSDKNLNIDSYLLTMPNNPDGFLPSLDKTRTVSEVFRDNRIPLIHDAVYYTRSYLPVDYPKEAIGDMQIFSASKKYGLSSLRLGYIVVYNPMFYRTLLDFVELSTVGISVASQKIFLHLLQREKEVPLLEETFNKNTREVLKSAKKIFKTINPEYIEIPPDFDQSFGVFAWVKPKVKDIFVKTNLKVLDGKTFGMNGYVRINLAAGTDIIQETVNRLNNYKP